MARPDDWSMVANGRAVPAPARAERSQCRRAFRRACERARESNATTLHRGRPGRARRDGGGRAAPSGHGDPSGSRARPASVEEASSFWILDFGLKKPPRSNFILFRRCYSAPHCTAERVRNNCEGASNTETQRHRVKWGLPETSDILRVTSVIFSVSLYLCV